MKLIFCKKCQDVFKLHRFEKTCQCGESGGRYLEDGVLAEYWGRNAIPVGFGNTSFALAVKERPKKAKMGKHFTAFVIPVENKACKKIRKPKWVEY